MPVVSLVMDDITLIFAWHCTVYPSLKVFLVPLHANIHPGNLNVKIFETLLTKQYLLNQFVLGFSLMWLDPCDRPIYRGTDVWNKGSGIT